MANDIDKTSPHYKGDFGSIYEVNKKFPTGGVAGDFVVIEGWAHYWNADRATWCVNAERDSYWDELITNIIEKFKLVRGATYMGVASLDTVPAKVVGAKMYYFATVAGTYKNFGDLAVPQGINVLYSENGSSWVCSTLLEVAQELGVSTRNVVSQKVVKDALDLKANQSAMDVELGKKADKAAMDVALGKKADKDTVDAELDTKVDKEAGKSLIDADVAAAHSVIDNPEFIEVETDADGKVLAGTYEDGSHYAYNMKSETIDELSSHLSEKIENLHKEIITESNVVLRNKQNTDALFSACRYNTLEAQGKDLQLCIVTDSHGETTPVDNAVKLTSNFDSIDAIIHCGDT